MTKLFKRITICKRYKTILIVFKQLGLSFRITFMISTYLLITLFGGIWTNFVNRFNLLCAILQHDAVRRNRYQYH